MRRLVQPWEGEERGRGWDGLTGVHPLPLFSLSWGSSCVRPHLRVQACRAGYYPIPSLPTNSSSRAKVGFSGCCARAVWHQWFFRSEHISEEDEGGKKKPSVMKHRVSTRDQDSLHLAACMQCYSHEAAAILAIKSGRMSWGEPPWWRLRMPIKCAQPGEPTWNKLLRGWAWQTCCVLGKKNSGVLLNTFKQIPEEGKAFCRHTLGCATHTAPSFYSQNVQHRIHPSLQQWRGRRGKASLGAGTHSDHGSNSKHCPGNAHFHGCSVRIRQRKPCKHTLLNQKASPGEGWLWACPAVAGGGRCEQCLRSVLEEKARGIYEAKLLSRTGLQWIFLWANSPAPSWAHWPHSAGHDCFVSQSLFRFQSCRPQEFSQAWAVFFCLQKCHFILENVTMVVI